MGKLSQEEQILPTATITKSRVNPRSTRADSIRLCLISIAIGALFYTYHTITRTPPNHRPRTLSKYTPSWKQHRSLRAYSNLIESHHHHTPTASTNQLSPLESLLVSVPDPESARNASHSYTYQTHIAGTEGDRLSSLLVKEQWESLLELPLTKGTENVFDAGTKESKEALMGKTSPGVWEAEIPRVWVDTYYPYLNYPTQNSLTLTPPGSAVPSFIAKLIEDVLPEDATSSEPAPVFHGYSKNGTAKGRLIYAGKGTKVEFTELVKRGVDFRGAIAIVQYGGCFRGLKVSAAAEVGAIGVLIYTDPIEDGSVTVASGLLAYPNGPARQPSSVQRGSTQFLSIYPGDALTPGKPAYKEADRLPIDSPLLNIPSIPSLPISYEDALPLLKSLNGRGIHLGAEKADAGKKEGGLGYLGVEYWTGPSEETVEMVNGMDGKVTPIWNTMALIPGKIKDEVVILGNHNDAWTFGAGDPNSGTASVHEVVKAFGVLLKTGWQPTRTILIASWDAEEYGLIGSTEMVEDYAEWVAENVVAYVNVDVGASGTRYGLGASPSLADLFLSVSALVQDPDKAQQTLLDQVVAETASLPAAESLGKGLYVAPLGSGSDYTGFLQHIGIASGNVGYARKGTDPVYHYHSIYDSAHWMDTFGDPTFSHHVAVAKVMGLATIRLADSLFLPINVTAYAHELSYYLTQVTKLVETSTFNSTVDLAPLAESISNIISTAALLDEERSTLERILASPQPKGFRMRCHKKQIAKRVREVNLKLRSFERSFIDEEGLEGREWYRNLVVAPGRDLGYGATTFPGLTESLALDQDDIRAAFEAKRLVAVLEAAERGLRLH